MLGYTLTIHRETKNLQFPITTTITPEKPVPVWYLYTASSSKNIRPPGISYPLLNIVEMDLQRDYMPYGATKKKGFVKRAVIKTNSKSTSLEFEVLDIEGNYIGKGAMFGFNGPRILLGFLFRRNHIEYDKTPIESHIEWEEWAIKRLDYSYRNTPNITLDKIIDTLHSSLLPKHSPEKTTS